METHPFKAERVALKEWAVVIGALDRGEQTMIIRKGGVAEKRFTVKQKGFLLYPTYEHQSERELQPHFRYQLAEERKIVLHPSTVTIKNWALLESYLETYDLNRMKQLPNEYVWSPDYLEKRFAWKPERAVVALVLRVFRLREPRTVKVLPKYRGCRSWVELEEEVNLERSIPVLSMEDFQTRKQKIERVLRDS